MKTGDAIRRLHERCGDFWWYAILIFIACRSGDAIQAFIGLWLVPHYVPQAELGAALPLLQVGSAFGLPLSILVIPFSRWLTLYAARGEYGKIKRLLSIAFKSVGVAFVVALLAAHFVFPLFFERLRVDKGCLGVLIVAAGLIGPFASVFNNALQGLKRFSTIAFINIVGAPIRLVVLLALMPFHALAGYMCGQISIPFSNILVAGFSLRKELGRGVATTPLGRADVREMMRYTLPIAINSVIGTVMITWQMLLFRQRLPEVESAAYYIISRLAEVSAYVGMSLLVVVFPMAAEAREKGERGMGLLMRLLCGSFLPGLAVTAIFAVFGRSILSLVPLWRDYVSYAPLLTLYTLRLTIATVANAFFTFEIAAGRFALLWYWIPFALTETGVLIAFTGYGAFSGILPDCVVNWMASLSAARLDFFVWWLLSCSAAQLLAVIIHIALRSGKRQPQTP